MYSVDFVKWRKQQQQQQQNLLSRMSKQAEGDILTSWKNILYFSVFVKKCLSRYTYFFFASVSFYCQLTGFT